MVALLAKTASQKDAEKMNTHELSDENANTYFVSPNQANYFIGLLNDSNDTRNKVTAGSETESKFTKEISYLADPVKQQSSKGMVVAYDKNAQDSTSEDSTPAETEKLSQENAKLKMEIAYMI